MRTAVSDNPPMNRADEAHVDGTADQPRHYILGTAGHIDHGKTRLVHALTGTDTDRLPEEQRRGMTIELGFAELTIGNMQFGVVDVPGHERFVRTMVAGATAVDVALIVVAADDAVMPQTVEHLEILHLLGVSRAVVAITKTDVVETDMVELVAEDVRNLLAGSLLEQAPICPVSSATGEGLDRLKAAIVEVARDVPARPASGPFRMAIDRVFTVKGRGTVVTGSVLRGAVATGDLLEVWPHGDTCRVRDLQTHGVANDSIACGQRAAINVSGIDRERLQRGSELATVGYLQPSRMIDVHLHCLSSCERPLKSSSNVRLGISTVEMPVRVVLYDSQQLQPGASVFAQLRSGQGLTSTYGQRFIIRDETASRTIGGGAVLRPVARRKRRDYSTEVEILHAIQAGSAKDRVEQVLRIAGTTMPSDLHVCAHTGVELDDLPGIYEHLKAEKRWVPIPGTELHVVPSAIDDLSHRLTAWLARYQRSHPEEPGRHVDAVLGWLGRLTNPALARPLFDRLLHENVFKLLGSYVCLPQFAPSLTGADERLMAAMLAEIRDGGFQPPSLDTLTIAGQADRKRLQRLAKLAVALGQLVQLDAKLFLYSDVEQRLRVQVAELIQREGGVTVADVREALDSSRKFVVPFLEYLDRVGVTRRVDDRRVLASTDEQ